MGRSVSQSQNITPKTSTPPLNQLFPSFALIGPRTIDEINTSLPSLDIDILKENIDCLNLKKQERLKI